MLRGAENTIPAQQVCKLALALDEFEGYAGLLLEPHHQIGAIAGRDFDDQTHFLGIRIGLFIAVSLKFRERLQVARKTEVGQNHLQIVGTHLEHIGHLFSKK